MKYVALLRGITPSNPNMRNDKLRGVFEKLGFTNVRTVISSGNVLFESPSKSTKTLEATVEKALPKQLGFTSTTIIRSKEELQRLIDKNPFKDMKDTLSSRLNVTFLKNDTDPELRFPHRPEGKTYTILSAHDRAVCSVIDLTGTKTPDMMLWLEKQFGKELTTRTWKTMMRIADQL